MSDELVKYRCPVCGEVEYANAEDALVTCSNGHHLSLGGTVDEDGYVSAEVINEND